jgi:hypothetical protein
MFLVFTLEIIKIDKKAAEAKDIQERNKEKRNCKENTSKRSMKNLAKFENERISNNHL